METPRMILELAHSLPSDKAKTLLNHWINRAYQASKDHPLIGSLVRSMPPDCQFPLTGPRTSAEREEVEALEQGAAIVLEAHKEGHHSSYLYLILNTVFSIRTPHNSLVVGYHILVSNTHVPHFQSDDLIAEMKKTL